jgi:hypothetical protein
MAGSQMKARKGMRGDNPKGQPVTQQQGAGAKPKSMTAGKAKPASAWFK